MKTEISEEMIITGKSQMESEDQKDRVIAELASVVCSLKEEIKDLKARNEELTEVLSSVSSAYEALRTRQIERRTLKDILSSFLQKMSRKHIGKAIE